MTTKRTKPAADEAACPVAPLAREYARTIRARRALDDDKAADRLIEVTAKDEDDGGLSPAYTQTLLMRRQDSLQQAARQLCASSRIGIAFQMLLAHCDDLEANFPGDTWQRVTRDVRELSTRLDRERSGIIWTAYKALTAGMADPDLADLESLFGREMLTDAECVERVLAAVA